MPMYTGAAREGDVQKEVSCSNEVSGFGVGKRTSVASCIHDGRTHMELHVHLRAPTAHQQHPPWLRRTCHDALVDNHGLAVFSPTDLLCTSLASACFHHGHSREFEGLRIDLRTPAFKPWQPIPRVAAIRIDFHVVFVGRATKHAA